MKITVDPKYNFEWMADQELVTVVENALVTPDFVMDSDYNIIRKVHENVAVKTPYELISESQYKLLKQYEYSNLGWRGVKQVERMHLVNYYCGWHWGHFITETLGRCGGVMGGADNVWVNLSNHVRPSSLFSPDVINHNTQYFNDHWKWSEYLFGQRKVPVVDHPIRVERLELPNPQCYVRCQRGFTRNFLVIARAFGSRLGRSFYCAGRKVYLSKTRFTAGHRNIENEKRVEDILKSKGWNIVYPEMLTPQEQVDLWRYADVVAGVEGSAMHTALLTDQLPFKVILLSSEPPAPFHWDFQYQFDKLGVDATFIRCMMPHNKYLSATDHNGPFKRKSDQIIIEPDTVANMIEDMI